MLDTFLRKPLIPILLFYMGGILSLYESDFFNVLIPLFHFGLIFLLFRFRRVRWFAPVMVTVYVFGRVLTLLPEWIHDSENHLSHYITNQRIAVRGEVVRPIQHSPKWIRFHLKVDQLGPPDPEGTGYQWTDVTGKIRFKLYLDTLPADPGDRIQIDRVLLHKPRRFQNLGTFDYERWLKNRGVDATGWVRSMNQVTLLSKPPAPTLTARTERLKHQVSNLINEHALGDATGIIQAMVLGNTGYLTDENRERFQKSGIAHLLAISGLHMGFIAYFFYLILYPLTFQLTHRVFPRVCRSGFPFKLTAALTIPLICGYAFLIGYKVSAIRATIMIVVFLVSVLLGRYRDMLNTLAVAALIILIWNPASIYEAGFQLSFMAVLGIALTLNRFGSSSKSDQPLTTPSLFTSLWRNQKLELFFGFTISATLVTLPLVLYHFNQLILSGIVLNFIAIPVASVFIPLMFALVWISLLGFPQTIDFISYITLFITKWVGMAGEIPGSVHYLSTPPLLSILGFYLLLLLLLYWKNVRKKWASIVVILFLLIVPSIIKPGLFHSRGTLQVHFLDVGQGDSTLIRFPDGRSMLIDGGGQFGNFNVGQGVVEPYLRSIQVSKIDFLVASHSDSDHISGLFPLMKRMEVGRFIDNGVLDLKSKSSELQKLAKAAGVPYTPAWSERNIRFPSGVQIEVIHPTPEFLQDGRKNNKNRKGRQNNSSVVIRLKWNQLSLLFTGDIEHQAESYLVGSYDSLKADVLKVPHHGSRTSSTIPFLESVSPKYALISCGFRNWHGHPHPTIVKNYRDRGITLFRTDLNGEIVLEATGNHWRLVPFDDWKQKYSRFSLKNLFL